MITIQSENRRRQRIFNENGVNNINNYTRLYKSGEATTPVPHLFIIIDEFAELKREQPDFMRELISVAQVGRSLGVHLILSTQKPGGTVDDNIWSNSKFRLCLRVQDRQDSMDMLHKPDAVTITQAGRCYLQVGNDEVYELFQSGYSGASYDENMDVGASDIAKMISINGKVEMAGGLLKQKQKKQAELIWIGKLVYALAETSRQLQISADYAGQNDRQMGQLCRGIYSVLENEGKSTVAANIALAIADEGRKVLLIDADLRKPSIFKILNMQEENFTSLTSILRDISAPISSLESLCVQVPGTSLHVILNKAGLPQSMEMFSTNRFVELLSSLRRDFDYIIVDTPPMQLVADAEEMAPIADCCALVIRQHTVEAKDINDAIDALNGTGNHVIGCIFNNVYSGLPLPGSGRGYGYGYGNYGYGGHYGKTS